MNVLHILFTLFYILIIIFLLHGCWVRPGGSPVGLPVPAPRVQVAPKIPGIICAIHYSEASTTGCLPLQPNESGAHDHSGAGLQTKCPQTTSMSPARSLSRLAYTRYEFGIDQYDGCKGCITEHTVPTRWCDGWCI